MILGRTRSWSSVSSSTFPRTSDTHVADSPSKQIRTAVSSTSPLRAVLDGALSALPASRLIARASSTTPAPRCTHPLSFMPSPVAARARWRLRRLRYRRELHRLCRRELRKPFELLFNLAAQCVVVASTSRHAYVCEPRLLSTSCGPRRQPMRASAGDEFGQRQSLEAAEQTEVAAAKPQRGQRRQEQEQFLQRAPASVQA